MDLRVFEGLEFNPIVFINKAFESTKNKEQEEFVKQHVLKLQVFMKQLNISLDEKASQVNSAVPQVVKDANLWQHEFECLRQQVLDLEKHVMGVEENTGAYTKCLQRIDKIKSRLESATAAVEQFEKWTELVESLEEIASEGNLSNKEKIKEATAKIQSISKSLDKLSFFPDYHDKKLQLERLYTRLEYTMNDSFEEAVKKMDKDKTSSYMELYSSMNRSESASRSWHRAAAEYTAKRWASESEHTVKALTRILIEEAVKQMDWLTKVLKPKNPLDELLSLHTDLLATLDPTLTEVMIAKFKTCETPESKIKMLTCLRLDIDNWVECFCKVLRSTEHGVDKVTDTTLQIFYIVSYAPLRELLPNYADALSQTFLDQLKMVLVENEEEENEEDDDDNDEEEKEGEENEDENKKDENKNEAKKMNLIKRSKFILEIAEKCENWLKKASYNGYNLADFGIYPYYASAVESFASAILNDLINAHLRNIETSFLESVKCGKETGVFSETFPASLILEKSIVIFVDAFSKDWLQEDCAVLCPPSKVNLRYFVLTDEKLMTMTFAPPPSIEGFRRAKDTIKALSRTILRNPIDVQLDKIPQLSVWHNNDALSTDLPDFALSPQEYITEIGQYLITLPQHLEMYVSEEEEPLKFLNELCVHTCDMYAEKILNIRNMDALGTKRCLTDIVYLSSVVEDLGSKITPALKNLEKSLRAATPASPNEN